MRKRSLVFVLGLLLLLPLAVSVRAAETPIYGVVTALRPNTLGNTQQVWVGGSYQTIQAAIDSITDASASKPYVVRVPPGIYDEAITLQDYVSLVGAGRRATIIQPSSAGAAVFFIAANSVVKDLTIKSALTVSHGIGFTTNDITFWVIDCHLECYRDLFYTNRPGIGYFYNLTGKTEGDGFVFDSISFPFFAYIFNMEIELLASAIIGRGIHVAGGQLNGVVEMWGGRIYGSGAFGSLLTAGIDSISSTSTVKAYNVEIDLENTIGSGDVNGVLCTNGTVEVYGGNIATQEDTGTAYDLKRVAGSLEIYGTKYSTSTGIISGEALHGSDTWDPGNLVDGAGETKSITVTGTALGDFVLVAAPYDLQDLVATAYAQATNTVEIRLQNESGGAIDLASGTWKIRVLK